MIQLAKFACSRVASVTGSILFAVSLAAAQGLTMLGGNSCEAAELPTYPIDLQFQIAPSILQKGTPAQTDAYNVWISDPKNNPTIAREAYLDFGNRRVRVYLIGSRHDGATDVEFVRSSLEKLGVPWGRGTLFIEQGDSYSAGGGANQVMEKIRSEIPELLPAAETASRNKTSILNPEFSRKLVFGVVAREWLAHGGRFVNFDAASNYSEPAVRFLAGNLGDETAIRFLREGLFGDTFKIRDFKTFLNKGYGNVFQSGSVEAFGDCCGNLREWVKWLADDNQLRNLVRERFMKQTLAAEIEDGDVIVTHPAHVNNFLAPEKSP